MKGSVQQLNFRFPISKKSPRRVKAKFESLPTKVIFFRMLGYSPGTFVEVIDLTNATQLFNSMGREKQEAK